MRRVLASSGRLRGLLAVLLTAFLAGQLAVSVLPARSHDCGDCGHGSCPKRKPVQEPGKPPCHGESSARTAPSPLGLPSPPESPPPRS